jgi:Rieske Fe-S protein
VAEVAEQLAVGAWAVYKLCEDGEYVAFEQKCTHLSCAVVYSRERDRLECPCHQGYFSATTGAVLQGPPPRPLARIRLEKRGDELVAVGIKTDAEL